MRKALFGILTLVLLTVACGGGGAQNTQSSTDLFVVVGNSAYGFTGNGNGDGLLLDKFSQENRVGIFVQVANDRDVRDFRDKMLEGIDGAPDVLIVDDSLDIDGLQKIKMVAAHKVGVAIRSDVANALGLQGNILSYTDFVSMMKSGNLVVVASSAMAGSASREFFFSTMAWCANMDASNLTADIVKLDYVQACGKDVFDHVKSTNGANEALDLVYNAAYNGDAAGSNTIIAFDSDLLGAGGLNAKLANAGKSVFRFFYFREATAQANMAIGSRDLSKDETRLRAVDKLIGHMMSDGSQEAINLAGFTEGSAALVRHIDTAFKSEWGVASNPANVQIVNAPISAVAAKALDIYRDYYKRMKVVEFKNDVSPSMFQNIMKVSLNGVPTDVYRIQALDMALLKTTNSQWLADNKILPGLNDKFNYYFFSTVFSGLVTNTVGPETDSAGVRLDYFLGVSTDINVFNQRTMSELNGFQSNGTHIFDAASDSLNRIIAEYDPNVDYYIVILTDGDNNTDSGLQADDFYKMWNDFYGKNNVTVIGIQFGGDGNSIAKDCQFYCSSIGKAYTQQFGGDTYFGNNDADLVEAFKKIIGR